MAGFRVTVIVRGSAGSISEKKKCLVFVEDKWTKVADLEAHMKKVLGVKRLEVFIDDCWVSSEEPLCIVKPSDTITVKLLGQCSEYDASTQVSQGEDEPEKKEKRSKRRKVELSPERTAEPEVADEAALSAKKAALLQKVEAALSPESMDVADDGAEPTKKKRRRKRPSKKRKELMEKLSVGAALLSCMTQQSDGASHLMTPPEEVATVPTSSHHIRFDEEPCQGDTDRTEVDFDTPIEDWQQRLLSLAQERKKPVFVRSEMVDTKQPRSCDNGSEVTNGLNLNGCANVNGNDAQENGHSDQPDACRTSYIHNSVPTESAKANDLLYFKKLTVVDGKPEISDHLLALVEEVNDFGSVVLKIFEGSPEQAFTPDEIQDSEDGCFVVSVDWRHIIEPRLIVETSLLSKYL